MKIKTLLRILFTPDCWIRNEATDKKVDKLINKLLNEHEIEYNGSCVGSIAGIKIWLANYPYAFGSLYDYEKIYGLPSRKTCFKLYDMIKDIEKLTKQNTIKKQWKEIEKQIDNYKTKKIKYYYIGDSMDNYKFPEEDDKILCNYIKCAAGMGLAGNGNCFLRGEWDNSNCPKFQDEEEFQKKMKEEYERLQK